MCVRERCSAVRTFWATHLTEDAEHIGTDKEEEEGGTERNEKDDDNNNMEIFFP